MKKRLLSLLLTGLLAALLLSLLAFPALADSQRTLPLVVDVYGLLSEEQEEALNELAEGYSAQYECDIILIVTTDTEGYDVESYTEAVYHHYQYGWGEERSGVILLLSMEGRDYDLAAYGYGNVAFTDYGKTWLMDDVLPYLGKNDWYNAFRKYIDLSADYLRQAREGNPVDYYGGGKDDPWGGGPDYPTRSGFYVSGQTVLIALIAGLIPAGITVLIMRAKMKSARLQTQADSYAAGLQLRDRQDRFINKTVSRVRRDTDSGGRSGGGGHGTSVHSSGFSHHSGKF